MTRRGRRPLFEVFREAPDYGVAGGAETPGADVPGGAGLRDPSDVESAEPASGAGDNEYIVVVEVRSGEGERERKGRRAIRVRVSDEEEPPEITSVGPFEVVENQTRVGQLEAVDQDKQDEITEYGIAGGADGGLFEGGGGDGGADVPGGAGLRGSFRCGERGTGKRSGRQ